MRELGGQRLSLVAEGERFELELLLVGAFQASNALVAAGLCIAAGEPFGRARRSRTPRVGAPGRLQRVGVGANGGEAYVDYAHTPDGLQTVLTALRPHTRGRLIVVFGCGGNRDRGKRPIMGEIAARLADIAIVTDDNPRSEDPAAIRAAILDGAAGAREIGDRKSAIAAAAVMLGEGDVLVVAGKGHEQGQTTLGVTFIRSTTWRSPPRRLAWAAPMADPLWTSEAVVRATGGQSVGPAFAAGGVSIDTRSLEPATSSSP